MSGHSKWSTIKRQKGVTDAKRGQVFTKLANAITLAVKHGGVNIDPNSNFKLRLAMDKARSFNMPKDNIDRAIERGMGTGAHNTNFDEVIYEGFGPKGIVFIVEALTDNKNRTTSEVKNIIEKNGGTLGSPGSVNYLFERKGELIFKKNAKSSDDILSIVLDAGGDDIEEDEDNILVTATPENLQTVKQGLEEKGVVIDSAEIVYKAKTVSEVDENIVEQSIAFLDKIEEQDDVQNVYSNLP